MNLISSVLKKTQTFSSINMVYFGISFLHFSAFSHFIMNYNPSKKARMALWYSCTLHISSLAAFPKWHISTMTAIKAATKDSNHTDVFQSASLYFYVWSHSRIFLALGYTVQ